MAGSKTNVWANAVNDGIVGGSGLVVGGTLYVCLSAAAFDPALLDGSFSELVGNGYTRLAVPNNKTYWSVSGASVARTISNLLQLIFPGATGSWSTILSAYLATTATPGAGMLLYGADVSTPVAVPAGRAYVIGAGQFAVTER